MSNTNRRGRLAPRASELTFLACRSVAAPSADVAVPALKSIDSNRLERVKELGADDQLDQIEDSEASAAVFDVKTFRERGGELAARAAGLKTVFTLGPAECGGDLVSAIKEAGSTTPVDLARPGDVASLNCTGGTTGKSKAALRHHGEYPSSPPRSWLTSISRRTPATLPLRRSVAGTRHWSFSSMAHRQCCRIASSKDSSASARPFRSSIDRRRAIPCRFCARLTMIVTSRSSSSLAAFPSPAARCAS